MIDDILLQTETPWNSSIHCHHVIQQPGVAPRSLSQEGPQGQAHVVVTFFPGPETSAEEPGANGPGLAQRNVDMHSS